LNKEISHHPFHALYYNFAHVVLPHLTYSNPLAMYETLMDENRQESILALWVMTARKLGLNPEEIPMTLVCEKVKDKLDEIELFLISFPPPLEFLEVYFEAIMFKVINLKQGVLEIGDVMIFTLEKSTFEDMCCGWSNSGKQHVNFGPIKNHQKPDFIDRIKQIIISKQ